jgi:hypothetical protein
MPWRHMREWRYSSTILGVGTRLRGGQLHDQGNEPSGTHCIGGCVCPIADLDDVKKINLAPAGNRTPAVKPVARRYIPSYIDDIKVISGLNPDTLNSVL